MNISHGDPHTHAFSTGGHAHFVVLSMKITDVKILCWLMYILCLDWKIVNILHRDRGYRKTIKGRKQLYLLELHLIQHGETLNKWIKLYNSSSINGWAKLSSHGYSFLFGIYITISRLMFLKKFQMASIEISPLILNISWGISVTVVFYYVFFWNCEHIWKTISGDNDDYNTYFWQYY